MSHSSYGTFILPIRLSQIPRLISTKCNRVCTNDFFPNATRPHTNTHDSPMTLLSRQLVRSLLEQIDLYRSLLDLDLIVQGSAIGHVLIIKLRFICQHSFDLKSSTLDWRISISIGIIYHGGRAVSVCRPGGFFK